jgi:hypothetical protein
MDLTFISTAASALSAAREFGKAAVGLRDFNELATVVAKMNEQILNAQDSLFSHQTKLFAINEEVQTLRNALAEAHQKLEQRGRYELFVLSPGVYVYRSKADGGSTQVKSEPAHFVCQPCFDVKGERGILLRMSSAVGISHRCPLCETTYRETEIDPNYDCSPTRDYDPYDRI